jgi:hypothetical protein
MNNDDGESFTCQGAIKSGYLAARLVNCPYKVFLSGKIVDEFYDARDAIAAARAAKAKHPDCLVRVFSEPSGTLIAEI